MQDDTRSHPVSRQNVSAGNKEDVKGFANVSRMLRTADYSRRCEYSKVQKRRTFPGRERRQGKVKCAEKKRLDSKYGLEWNSESERDSFRMGVENAAIGMQLCYALVL